MGIGDWVLLRGYPNYPLFIDGLKDDMVLFGNSIADTEELRNTPSAGDYDDIEPIPLTAEIIEKNGVLQKKK